MKLKILAIGICWLGLAANAFAYTSRFSAMAVSGSAFTNYWTIAPNMELVGDNLWQGAQEITNGAGGFKFAADDNWTFSWGGDAALARVPAAGRAQRDFIGNNLEFSGLTPGSYLFTFNDVTLDFRLDWNGAAPLPPPAISGFAVVGDFNARAPTALHLLTNHPADPDLWSRTIELDTPVAFQFRPNGNPSDPWGAPETALLSLPGGNLSVCGTSDFALPDLEPGTFLFALNASNATFAISRTATQEISGMTVQGNFIATNAPPPNMTWLDGASWESDHHITNSGTITLRFAAQNDSIHWGATNTFALPASGSLAAGSTNYAQVTGVSPGRYRITFNHQTGAFGFRPLYADDSGLNLLQNPGFEITTLPEGGDAADWESSQAWPRRVADGYAPHSGNWCGTMGNGSFEQEVSVVSGETYRASAWLKATPAGISNSMRIQIRWLDATNGNLGPWAFADVPGLTTRWVKYSAERTAPFAATKARVVFLCPNDGPYDCMHVDDVEMRAIDRRAEDFTDWTDPAYAVPGDHSRCDWSIQSAGIATGGVLGSRSALLAPASGAIVSPAFDAGVGRTLFWVKAVDTNSPAYLLLQTTTNGSDWTTQAALAATNGVLLSSWLHVAASGAQARIVFDPAKTSGSVLVDNIDIFAPALHRDQNFDDWPLRASSTNDSHQGWFVTSCVVSSSSAYEGQAARLNTNIGNYVRSPELPEGVGTISFRTRKALDIDGTATVQVQLSSNGVDWTTTTSVSPASTNYQSLVFFLQDATNRHVRLYHSAGAFRVLIDDIQIGVPHPRPGVIVSCGLDPAYPIADEPMAITANVATRDEAAILSVTGYYQVASTSFIAVPMAAVGEGAYVSVSNIPGQSAGTRIRHYVRVQYAGVGANTNFSGYGTNTQTTATRTNFVASVPRGRVWINELFYAPYDLEPWFMLDVEPWWELVGCNHEYLELCGRAGADISGWTIQLAFGRDADIAANGGQPIYASYAIPAETVFADQTNGFGFYVLGDAELIDSGEPIDQVLTTLVPTNISLHGEFYGAAGKDHFHDGVGVIRLLDQFNNVVYSLSYNGDVPGSDPILPVQDTDGGETSSIGLSGIGASYGMFEWGMGDVTIGSPNANQTLVYPYASAWHVPGQSVTPLDTNLVSSFFQFNPQGAGHFDAIDIYYGYTNAAYPNPAGTLFHRSRSGAAPWIPVAMSACAGSLDANGHAYVSGRIPDHTYQRLQTLEYVVAVDPNANGLDPVYLGSDAGDPGVSAAYASFAEAEAHPFAYSLPIADLIAITNLLVDASNIILQTTGNDPADPITNFHVKFTADLLLPGDEWTGTHFTATPNDFANYSFHVQTDTSIWPKVFFRIDPLWP